MTAFAAGVCAGLAVLAGLFAPIAAALAIWATGDLVGRWALTAMLSAVVSAILFALASALGDQR